MQRIFTKHPETVLTILALVFLAVIAMSFSWGIGKVAGEVNGAMNPDITLAPSSGFDLGGAAALDLKGLVKTQP